MSELLDHEVEEIQSNGHADAQSPPVDLPANSLLARIKAERDARLVDESLLLPIPTWDGNLVGKYVVVDGEEFRSRTASSRDVVEANVAFLVDALQALYLRDESGELVLIEDQAGPVGFDTRLADQLGIEATAARDVLLHLVGNNTLALNAHSLVVAQWMQDTSQEVEGALAGESLA